MNLKRNIPHLRGDKPKTQVNRFSRFGKLPEADTSLFSMCYTERGEENLKKGSLFYHSQNGAFEEAERAVVPLINKGSTSVAIYGIGLGYYYDALRPWLDNPAHQLVFIEDDWGALQMFLRSPRAENILTHPQISIVLWGFEENLPFLANLSTDFYFLSLPLYRGEKIYGELVSHVYSLHAYLSDLWLYQEQANCYYHLSVLDEYRTSQGLENQFSHLPLIICGAGPSIQKQLSDLATTKGVVAAAGTGINILNHAGLQPDLGISFDPKPSGARRLQSSTAFKVPFIVDIDSAGAWYLNGPKILTWTNTEARWKHRLIHEIGMKGGLLTLPQAISSTHYVIELGIRLGCPIEVLVGVDLAYVGGKQYPGIKTWVSDHDPHSGQDLIEVMTMDQRRVQVSRIYYKEAIVYSEIVRQHPEIQFYTTSREGLLIQGVSFIEDISFPETAQKSLEEMICSQPFFDIPLTAVKAALIRWRKEIEDNPDLLLEEYRKRLDLKFEAKKRYLQMMELSLQPIEDEKREFEKKVVQLHLKEIDRALETLDNKLTTPKKIVEDEIPYKEGKVRLYYDNGQLKSESDLVGGLRHGSLRFYSREGKMIEEVKYSKGVPVDETFSKELEETKKLLNLL